MIEALISNTDYAMLMLLVFVTAGVLCGFLVGALPGFDITTGVALLLPVSYLLPQELALGFLTAMYCAGVFGGSITAILFGIPGTSESVMSAIEGYPMTKRGEPGFALGIAVLCSGLSGVLATFVLVWLSSFLANIALQFSPGDYAALGIFGCAAVVSTAAGRQALGLLALLFGLWLSTIGTDPISGELRYVVVPFLRDGVDLIPAIIGLFAVGDVLERMYKQDYPGRTHASVLGKWSYPGLKDYLRLRWTFLRSWLLGIGIGILPGAGASSAAFVAHSIEKRISTGKEREDVESCRANALAAPETAINAAAVGSLVPLLSLGIPGSATAAVILGAFQIHDLQPGPLLFLQEPELVHQIFVSVAAANIIFVLASIVLMRPISRVINLPYAVQAMLILSLAVTGSIATGGLAAVSLMVVFSILGFGMRRLKLPLGPLILGLVLGPLIEVYARRGLLMADGNMSDVFASPLAATLLVGATIMIAAPAIRAKLRRTKNEHQQ